MWYRNACVPMKPQRFTYLATATFFLFFLVYSAPHRVHHFFDKYPAHQPPTVEQSAQSGNHSKAPDVSCVFHLAAKSCHLVSAAVHVAALPVFFENFSSWSQARIAARFLSNAFLIRAPPKT